MATVRQTSFGSGEIAPTLQGRVDLDQYATGLRRLRNCFVSRLGAAVSRPGTAFVAEVKDSTKEVRLVPFIFSDEVAYVLEFGNLYIRIHSDGAPVEVGGVPVEVVTTYLEADLPRLKFAQSGDVLFITHPDYVPRTLSRMDAYRFTVPKASIWKISEFDVEVTLAGHGLLTGDIVSVVLGGAELYFGAGSFAVTVISSSVFRYTDTWSAPGSVSPDFDITYTLTSRIHWVLEELAFDAPAFFGLGAKALSPIPTADATHPEVVWTYKITGVGRYSTGEVVESLPFTVTQNDLNVALPSKLVVYPDRPFTLDTSVGTSYPNPEGLEEFLGYNVYRGRNGVFGYVGTTVGQGPDFVDAGGDPDFLRPPPQGRNPFEVTVGGVGVTENPTAVCFFDDRLVLAGTEARPERVFASATAAYTNFDEKTPSTADESVEFSLAARTREGIRAVIPKDRLLIFTNSSVWAAGGPGGAPLSATDLIDARVQLEVGASWLDPLLVGHSVLFVRTKGFGVLDLNYDNDRRTYVGGDLSILAEHLLLKKAITSWAYAEDPWGVVWAVRSDGKLLSLTYVPSLGVVAWGWHDSEGIAGAAHTGATSAYFEQVCAVPETTEDGVYLVVRRTVDGVTKRYIERMTDRVVAEDTAAEDVICLDCSATYVGAAATVITGLAHLKGKTVYALADGAVVGPLVVSAAGEITLTTAASLVHVGLRYFAELETLNSAEARLKKKTVRKVAFEVAGSRGIYTGEDFDSLTAWDPEDPAVLSTGLVEVDVTHGWNQEGRAVLRQSDPLPVTVHGILRELEGGGG